MSDIIQEFREKHPEGTFEDWVEFYFEEYNGEDRLEELAEKAYPMVEKMREAFEKVDKEMTQRYIRDLVLFKTYEGFDIQEAILRELGDMNDPEVRRATAAEESKGIDGYIGGQSVQIKPVSHKDNLQESFDTPIIYYDENRTNKAMKVDISGLNQEIDVDGDNE